MCLSLRRMLAVSLGPGWEPSAESWDPGPPQAPPPRETTIYQSQPQAPSCKSGEPRAGSAAACSVIDRKPHWSLWPGNPKAPGGNPRACPPLPGPGPTLSGRGLGWGSSPPGAFALWSWDLDPGPRQESAGLTHSL